MTPGEFKRHHPKVSLSLYSEEKGRWICRLGGLVFGITRPGDTLQEAFSNAYEAWKKAEKR
jgi:hypothetical protein